MTAPYIQFQQMLFRQRPSPTSLSLYFLERKGNQRRTEKRNISSWQPEIRAPSVASPEQEILSRLGNWLNFLNHRFPKQCGHCSRWNMLAVRDAKDPPV